MDLFEECPLTPQGLTIWQHLQVFFQDILSKEMVTLCITLTTVQCECVYVVGWEWEHKSNYDSSLYILTHINVLRFLPSHPPHPSEYCNIITCYTYKSPSNYYHFCILATRLCRRSRHTHSAAKKGKVCFHFQQQQHDFHTNNHSDARERERPEEM